MTARRGPFGIGIRGTGSFLPVETVPNSVVAERAGVTADWIVRKTAIRERRYAAADEATSDLAVAAAASALADAGVRAGDLAWIVVATSTPDQPQPATASLVQHRLGADGAAVFDLNAVCSGFVYALVTVAALLSGGTVGARRHGLVVGAEVYSRIIDPADRRTAVLFGDGAGAVVLGPVRAGYGIVGSDLIGFGQHHDMIGVPAGAAAGRRRRRHSPRASTTSTCRGAPYATSSRPNSRQAYVGCSPSATSPRTRWTTSSRTRPTA